MSAQAPSVKATILIGGAWGRHRSIATQPS